MTEAQNSPASGIIVLGDAAYYVHDEVLKAFEALRREADMLRERSIQNARERNAAERKIERITANLSNVDALAYRFWSIHPAEVSEWMKTAPPMPEKYPGGGRAWFHACSIRALFDEVTQ